MAYSYYLRLTIRTRLVYGLSRFGAHVRTETTPYCTGWWAILIDAYFLASSEDDTFELHLRISPFDPLKGHTSTFSTLNLTSKLTLSRVSPITRQ
ncbi:unnamed protein product [Leptosia nina]|uniref:Uncharacterized protein n=1 Tax=Leptosia nina TaxID=320188 RepID=A0AAV1JM40_9NEOP